MNNENSHEPKPTQSWTEWVEMITPKIQQGVQEEIAEHLGKGNPIYYLENGKSIVQNSNGERFEYIDTDNGIEIIGKIE